MTIEGSSGNATFSGQLKTEGTIVLDREGDASYATLVIISDDAQRKQVQFKNQDNSRRWNVGSTESSDADFFIEAFNNANVSQGNYFEIERATGNATFSGDVIASSGDIYLGSASPSLTISGGSNASSGGQIQLNGEGSASANDIIFRTSGVEKGRFDESGSRWTFFQNMRFGDYGVGNKTGTATYALGVDGSGNVVETSASGNAWLVHTQTVTSSEILSMGTTPITLIQGQGTGTLTVLGPIFLSMDYNGTAYSNENIEIEYDNASQIYNVSSFLNSNVDRIYTREPSATLNLGGGLGYDIRMTTVSGSNPTTGNSDIKVTLFYKVITI